MSQNEQSVSFKTHDARKLKLVPEPLSSGLSVRHALPKEGRREVGCFEGRANVTITGMPQQAAAAAGVGGGGRWPRDTREPGPASAAPSD